MRREEEQVCGEQEGDDVRVILTWHIRKQMTFHGGDVDVWKRWQVIVSSHTRGIDCFRLVDVVDVVHHSSACREVSERAIESFEISEISECVQE